MRRFFTSTPAVVTAVLIASGIGLGVAHAATDPIGPGPYAPGMQQSDIHANRAAIAAATHPPVITEASFRAITPCRIVDTRSGGGAIANHGTRTFHVSGTSGFSGQGGAATGCGVPASATSVSVNITGYGSTAAGYITLYPAGASRPTATALYYRAGTALSGGANVSLGTGGQLAAYNSGSASTVVIDVTGYYNPPIEGLVSPDGSVFSGSARIVSSTNTSTGVYSVTIDTDVSYCTPMVDPYFGTNLYATAYNFNSTKVTVRLWQIVSGTVTPVNGYFYLFISC